MFHNSPFCSYCGASKNEVKEYHERHGHSVFSNLRYDLVPDDTLCEDCIDDVLEDMMEL